MQKPTHKALFGKIRDAIDAFKGGRIAFACEARVEDEIDRLGLADVDAFLDLIYECLQLAETDPEGAFRQPFPDRSTRHELTMNLPMWAFVVRHPDHEQEIYFKFCLKPQADGTTYCHIDCHGNRPPTP